MPAVPNIQPRFSSMEVLQGYLSVAANSSDKEMALRGMLASVERFVERYTRRYFTPEPALANPQTGFQRRLVGVSGSQIPVVNTGEVGVVIPGAGEVWIPSPSTAAQAQTLFAAALGQGNVTCSGGPLPTYPISVTFAGTLFGSQPAWTVDNSLMPSGFGYITDCGFDSAPPVLKRFTTSGRSFIRLPDLRYVDPGSDPRNPAAAGVQLYQRRLLPNQYSLGYNAYAEGGADDIGSPDAEPATHITLGYAWGVGLTLDQQFSYISAMQYLPNDLQIVGRWGWPSVPEDVADAIYRITARSYRERESSFSDQIVSPVDGTILAFFKTMPAFVQAAIDNLRVPNFALV